MVHLLRMALEPARLQDFQVNQSIGAGSTAKVFDAVHLATGRQVALKTLEQEAEQSAELRERLAREAFILAGVDSKHVGRILGFGYDKDMPFLVLERLHGETLDALIKREGQLSTRQVVHWVEQLLLGVRDCHAAGIVHRDIKPSNVFLQDEGAGAPTVKLIDFGVARLRELTQAGVGLTQTNHLLGSMGYMAPEQFHDPKSAGPPADLYAVGVVLFRVIAGRLPFVHRSLEAVIRMKCEADPPLLSSMANVVSIDALDQFTSRALARDPKNRFQSAREMLDEWWNVVTYIDEEAPLTLDSNALDVVFDDETEQDLLLRTLSDVATGSFPAATQREPYLEASLPAASSTRTAPDTVRPPMQTLVDDPAQLDPGKTAPGTHSVKRLLEEELSLQQKPPTRRGT
jgi:serine/threonine protein kinase